MHSIGVPGHAPPWTNAILHLHSQEADVCMKVIIKRANTTLFDLLISFHYNLTPLVM